MNIIRKFYTIALTFGMICLLSGCQKSVQEMALTWETVNDRVQAASRQADYDATEHNGITYYFEANILSEDDRSEYIKNTDKLYNKLWELHAGTPNTTAETESSFSVYIGNSLTTLGTSGKAFIKTQDIQSYQGMTAILMSTMTEAVNYGQAYGITVFLCKDLKLADMAEQSFYSDEALAEYYENQDNLCLLDFFLPVFEPIYVDETVVAYAQASAASFENYYIEKAGLQNAFNMCIGSADPDADISLSVEKNEWLTTIGLEGTYHASSYVIPFLHNLGDNKATYPYTVSTASAQWYPALEDIKLTGYPDFVSSFADTLRCQETDFAQARELLHDYIENDIPPVTIYTDFTDESDTSNSAGAFYRLLGNYIKLFHGWPAAQSSLLHEYVHYLTMMHGIYPASNGFFAEGIAEEIALMECDNRLAALYWNSILSETHIDLLQKYNMWDYENSSVDNKAYEMAYGALMYLGYGDGQEYLSVGLVTMTRSGDTEEPVTADQLTYYEAAGMICYLTETYGMDAVYKNCSDLDTLEAACGKTFSELYEEWGKWNVSICEKAGINLEELKELL